MAILLIVAGVLIGPESIWLAIILLIIGGTVYTAAYKISIDPARQTFREYLFLAGIKIGKVKKYNSVEDISVSSQRISQTVNSRASTNTYHTIMYKGFVKFNDHDKVLIAESQVKKKVLKKLNRISSALELKISDYAD